MKFALGLTLCFSIAGGAAVAQSLAELAEKEKQRREKLRGEEAQSFTDVDLRTIPGAGAPLTDSTASSAREDEEATTDSDDEESQQEDPTQTREYWQGRLRPIDQRIADLEARLASPVMTANPRGAPERQRVERDLAAARAERQALVDEARRQGAPPGWLR